MAQVKNQATWFSPASYFPRVMINCSCTSLAGWTHTDFEEHQISPTCNLVSSSESVKSNSTHITEFSWLFCQFQQSSDWAMKKKFLLSTKLAYIQIHLIVLEANILEIRVPAHHFILKLVITLPHFKRIFVSLSKNPYWDSSFIQKNNTSKVKPNGPNSLLINRFCIHEVLTPIHKIISPHLSVTESKQYIHRY